MDPSDSFGEAFAQNEVAILAGNLTDHQSPRNIQSSLPVATRTVSGS